MCFNVIGPHNFILASNSSTVPIVRHSVTINETLQLECAVDVSQGRVIYFGFCHDNERVCLIPAPCPLVRASLRGIKVEPNTRNPGNNGTSLIVRLNITAITSGWSSTSFECYYLSAENGEDCVVQSIHQLELLDASSDLWPGGKYVL